MGARDEAAGAAASNRRIDRREAPMRKLVMWNLVTLDGLFEGAKPWDLAFHELVWGDELQRLSLGQLDGAAALLFGRATYEGMAAYWPTDTTEPAIAERMNRLPKVVCSRTLREAGWRNARVAGGSAEEAVAALKREGDGEVLVFGSATLCEALARADLMDEYRLVVVPVVLGSGRPLFAPGAASRRLRLLEATPLRSGAVVLRYAPQRAG
jgi:dihydrofolate reductase